MSNLKVLSERAGFNLWEGSFDLGVLATGSVAVEVLDGNDVVDLLFL